MIVWPKGEVVWGRADDASPWHHLTESGIRPPPDAMPDRFLAYCDEWIAGARVQLTFNETPAAGRLCAICAGGDIFREA